LGCDELKYSEVLQFKKQDPASPATQFYRQVGLLLTWILINVVPSVTANAVTLAMLALNLLAAILLYYSLAELSWVLLVVSFLVANLAMCLDCVDGNIARIKNQNSLFGVYLDRLAHNIANPTLLVLAGFGIHARTENLFALAVCLIAGVLIELSPFEYAYRDLEVLFLRQSAFGNTHTYDPKHYRELAATADEHKKRVMKLYITKVSKVLRTVKSYVSTCNKLYLIVTIDMLLIPESF